MKTSHAFLGLALLLPGATCYAAGHYTLTGTTDTYTDTIAEHTQAPQMNTPRLEEEFIPFGFDGVNYKTLSSTATWVPDPNQLNEPPGWYKISRQYTVTGEGTATADGNFAVASAYATGVPARQNQYGPVAEFDAYVDASTANPHPPSVTDRAPGLAWTVTDDYAQYGSQTFNVSSQVGVEGGIYYWAPNYPSFAKSKATATNVIAVSIANASNPYLGGG